MFYACEALLFSRRLAYSSHSSVVAAFGKEFAKTGEVDAKYHRYLIDALDARNISDYGEDMPISVERSRQIIDWVTEFVSMVDEYFRNHHEM